MAAQTLALGTQFQVNTYTTDAQLRPIVVTDVTGGFVVVWESYGSSGSDVSQYSIQGQRYNAAGAPLSGQFQVNSYTTKSQMFLDVAAAPAGGFVVVWESYGSNGSDSYFNSVQAQRYDGVGTPLGGEIQVNTYTTNDQIRPNVATDPAGGFVVVWASHGSSGSDLSQFSIQGRRYSSAGAPLGAEFQVNTYTTSSQLLPAVATDTAGGFIVVWQSLGSSGSDTDLTSIQAQRYSSAGAPLGAQFQVNTYTISWQLSPAVASLPSGFVVVWQSDGSSGSDTDLTSIQGQRYDAGGAPLGLEFQINGYTTRHQGGPAVASDQEGGFVVAWWSDGSSGSDTDSTSIQGRRYDTTGTPTGAQFQVNTYTTMEQTTPTVATSPNGAFVVVWESNGSSGSDNYSTFSIQAQRYHAAAIFSDGFESGDLSAWSGAVP